MRLLIVTADDFGSKIEINTAVEHAHVHGVLTTTSLMVSGRAADDAIARAQRLPSLCVGLHVTLIDGLPVLPPSKIPDLVLANGSFRNDMTRLSVDIAFNRQIQRQVEAEVSAQFETFLGSGLKLDHVNMHKHFQLHPTVGRILMEVGCRFGMRAVRVPREPQTPFRRAGEQIKLSAIAMNGWASFFRRRVRTANVNYCDQVFGIRWTGAMTTDRLSRIIPQLPDKACEIYMHPASTNHFPGATPGCRYKDELDALIDPCIAGTIRSAGRHLGGYAALSGSLLMTSTYPSKLAK